MAVMYTSFHRTKESILNVKGKYTSVRRTKNNTNMSVVLHLNDTSACNGRMVRNLWAQAPVFLVCRVCVLIIILALVSLGKIV